MLVPNHRVTMRRTLNFGKLAPDDCYILQKDLVPSDCAPGMSDDRRHRAELNENSDKGFDSMYLNDDKLVHCTRCKDVLFPSFPLR